MSELSELGELFWTNEAAVIVLPTWTETRTEDLLRLARDGLSASQIAAKIGVTRNAVIGKLSRIGKRLRGAHGGRRAPPPKPAIVKPAIPGKHIVVRPGRRASAEVERVELPVITDLPPDTSPDAISLIDISFDQCRFPLNSTADINTFRFCGSTANGSYCPRHRRIVYRRSSQ